MQANLEGRDRVSLTAQDLLYFQPPPNQSSTTNLLDLPPELRLRIYDFILSDVSKREPCPWKVLPKQLSDFRSLILVSRKISIEVLWHFRKHYARLVLFHFDDIIDLYEFRNWALESKLFKEAQFCFRSLEFQQCIKNVDIVWQIQAMAALDLCQSQEGLPQQWSRYSYWLTCKAPCPPNLDGEFDLAALLPVRPPGFNIEIRTHPHPDMHWRSFDSQVITFPPTARNMQLFLHAADGQFLRTIELTGKLKDLKFHALDIDYLRRSLRLQMQLAPNRDNASSVWLPVQNEEPAATS